MLNLIEENHYTCLIKPTKELSACREIRAANVYRREALGGRRVLRS